MNRAAVITSIWALVSGIIFSLGLGLSGMTQPAVVIGFLDISGNWNPSLMFVMAGGIGVHALLYRWIMRRSHPQFDSSFHLPQKSSIDARLLAGATVFGIGWGLAGLCPGPALTSAFTGVSYSVVFVAFMLLGIWLMKFTQWMIDR